MALKSLESMVAGEPISTAIQSVLSIQQAVERFISGSDMHTPTQSRSDNSLSRNGRKDRSLPSIQFPSTDRNVAGLTGDLICFSERNNAFESTYEPVNIGLESSSGASADSMWVSNFDVLTTDLFSLSPT